MAEFTPDHLRGMKVGDRVLFYHSGKGKEVVGLAEVVKGAYPDPTADDPQWVAVDLKPVKPLATPVLGGMVSSMIHVLIVTPVIFTWLREREL